MNERIPNANRWLILIVILGIALRIARYALGLPMWMDECLLGVNILDRKFADLTRPMEYVQIAPIGFLYGQRAMYECFGMSEYVMRLLPTLAGICALILFAFWSRQILDPLAAIIATGILAVSDLCIRHAVELKPYSFDLLTAILLSMLATRYLLDHQRRWLIWLILATPIALAMSLPAIFIAAGILLTLLLIWPPMSSFDRCLTVVYALIAAAVFLLLFRNIIGTQYRGAAGDQIPLWAWPPREPIAFLRWLIHSHADNFFAYPVDVSYPWAGVSFVLVCIGAIYFSRYRNRTIAALLLLPFLMTLGAAMLHRYPYADSPRVGQHLAPAICLFMGVAVAALIRSFSPAPKTTRNVLALLIACALALGIASPISLILRPTSALRADRTARDYVRQLLKRIPPASTIAILQPPEDSSVLVRWYLHEWPGSIVWNAAPAQVLQNASTPVWFISTVPNAASQSSMLQITGRMPSSTEHVTFGSDDDGCCDVFVYYPSFPLHR